MSSRFRQSLVSGFAALCLTACTPSPDAVGSAAEKPYQNRLAERIAAAEENGASGIIRVTRNGQLVFERGFGSASCSQIETVTPSHLFMIGSITKDLTRVLGYALEEKGVLSLDKAVSEYIPGFDGEIGKVELNQLLDHTGGLPDVIDESGRPIPYSVDYDYLPVDRDELIERAQLAELIFEPGTSEEYSNLGYQLLAAVYEVVTGENYEALLRAFIFEPAGMTDTGFWFDDNANRQFADGCLAGGARWGNPIDDSMWDSTGPSWNLKGAGGLLSTAEGLARFFEGVGNGVYFQSTAQSERFKNGLMVYSDSRKQRLMATAGSNGIFNAVAFWADSSKFSIVLMTNRADHQAENELFRDVVELFPPEYFSASR